VVGDGAKIKTTQTQTKQLPHSEKRVNKIGNTTYSVLCH
jgi:hypothetical protein